MVEKYLLNRKEKLEGIIKNNKELYEHNQVAMVEMKEQIGELENTTDEATQIFSVIAREDHGFKTQEIENIEKRMAICVSENKDYERVIESTEKELYTVNECLNEIKRDNVSRETLENNTQTKRSVDRDEEESSSVGETAAIVKKNFSENKIKEILNKVNLCKQLAPVDIKRVLIELDNIIDMIDS